MPCESRNVLDAGNRLQIHANDQAEWPLGESWRPFFFWIPAYITPVTPINHNGVRTCPQLKRLALFNR